MRSLTLTAGMAALALALMSTTASAELALRGSLDVDYNDMSGDNNADGSLWNLNGNVLVPVSPNFNLQAGAGYHNLDGDVIGGDAWDVRGAAFWRGERGDFGVAIAHGGFSPDDGLVDDFDVTAYGAFGEFFVSENFTLSAQGGFLDGDSGFDGDYFGGGIKFYVIPNLSIAGNADRIHFDDLGHVTDLNVTLEWQPMMDTPLTLYGGYTNSDFSGTDFNIDTFMVGLRWRFGEHGTMLVDGDRNNVVRNTTVNFSNAFTF